jgi:hypothetical protein
MESLSTKEMLRSRLTKGKSDRAIQDIFNESDKSSFQILKDSEAVIIRRIALDSYLDFPHVHLGAQHESGIWKEGLEAIITPVGDFLSGLAEANVFLFMEPWPLRGAVSVKARDLTILLGNVLHYCDGSAKIYNTPLTKSCILQDHDGEIHYNILT